MNQYYPLDAPAAADGSDSTGDVVTGSEALILRPGFIYGDKPVPLPLGLGIMKLPLGWVGK